MYKKKHEILFKKSINKHEIKRKCKEQYTISARKLNKHCLLYNRNYVYWLIMKNNVDYINWTYFYL